MLKQKQIKTLKKIFLHRKFVIYTYIVKSIFESISTLQQRRMNWALKMIGSTPGQFLEKRLSAAAWQQWRRPSSSSCTFGRSPSSFHTLLTPTLSTCCFLLGLRHLLFHLQFLHPLHRLAFLLFQNVRRFMGQFQAKERTRQEQTAGGTLLACLNMYQHAFHKHGNQHA